MAAAAQEIEMSQHLFDTQYETRPVTILMGWDRPLQGYFMVIEYQDAAGDDDDYVYSNLMDADPRLLRRSGLANDLALFEEKLAGLGLRVPALMLAQIRTDAERNTGNRVVTYDPAGTMKEVVPA